MFWFLRRLTVSLILLWIVVTLVFMSIHFIPGDPVELLLSQDGSAPNPLIVEAIREDLGLNRPIWVQYVEKIEGLFRFDLGRSMIDNSSIATEISRRLPRTLSLIGMAAFLSLIIGLPAGIFAALRKGGWVDRGFSLLSGFFQSLPVFVVGTLIILIFSQILRLTPAGGFVPFSADPLRHIMLLLLPATTIAVGLSAIVFRITRACVYEVQNQDFIRTAHAKGLDAKRITVHHLLRNALIPVITVFALQLGSLLGGTMLVEYIFNWPGLSGMLIAAVNARDYPAVTAVILVISALFIALNFAVDILYGLVDPRART